jgi:GNAT superfamily N-acetyltransferase
MKVAFLILAWGTAFSAYAITQETKKIEHVITPSSDENKFFIANQLSHYNKSILGIDPSFPTPVPQNYVITIDGIIIAGINASISWNRLFIDTLFVHKQHRGKGYGYLLLEKVESAARKAGATVAHLESFQAKDFYLKQGYTIFGTLEDCPLGQTRYFLKKNL